MSCATQRARGLPPPAPPSGALPAPGGQWAALGRMLARTRVPAGWGRRLPPQRGGRGGGFWAAPSRGFDLPRDEEQLRPKGETASLRGDLSLLQGFDKRRRAGSVDRAEESSFPSSSYTGPRSNLRRGDPAQRWASVPLLSEGIFCHRGE